MKNSEIPNKIIKVFGKNREVIPIEMRKNKDVPNFIENLKEAYSKTKKNSLQLT